MNIEFPFRFDGRGRTSEVDEDTHIRQMIEQLLFTTPGERVNRPAFGSGLLQLVFAPGSDELAAATQFLVQGALQQFLGSLIIVNTVEVEAVESTIRLKVKYVVRRDQRPREVELVRAV